MLTSNSGGNHKKENNTQSLIHFDTSYIDYTVIIQVH